MLSGAGRAAIRGRQTLATYWNNSTARPAAPSRRLPSLPFCPSEHRDGPGEFDWFDHHGRGVVEAVGVIYRHTTLILGLKAFIVFGYLAVIAVNLPSLGISIVPETCAGEEAIGVSAFVLKALLRLAPTWLGRRSSALLHCWGIAVGKRWPIRAAWAGLPWRSWAAHCFTRSCLVCRLARGRLSAVLFYCLGIDVLRGFPHLAGEDRQAGGEG